MSIVSAVQFGALWATIFAMDGSFVAVKICNPLVDLGMSHGRDKHMAAVKFEDGAPADMWRTKLTRMPDVPKSAVMSYSWTTANHWDESQALSSVISSRPAAADLFPEAWNSLMEWAGAAAVLMWGAASNIPILESLSRYVCGDGLGTFRYLCPKESLGMGGDRMGLIAYLAELPAGSGLRGELAKDAGSIGIGGLDSVEVAELIGRGWLEMTAASDKGTAWKVHEPFSWSTEDSDWGGMSVRTDVRTALAVATVTDAGAVDWSGKSFAVNGRLRREREWVRRKLSEIGAEYKTDAGAGGVDFVVCGRTPYGRLGAVMEQTRGMGHAEGRAHGPLFVSADDFLKVLGRDE